MRIISCAKPEAGIQAASCHVERKHAALAILGHMAAIYELALTVHIPNSHLIPAEVLLPLAAPVLDKFKNSGFFRGIHHAFTRLSEFEIEYKLEPEERCRICSLVNVMCMMASSPFCAKTSAFIAKTAGGNETDLYARQSYNWTEAFRDFHKKAELPPTFRSGPRRIERAIKLATVLQGICSDTLAASMEDGVKKPHCPNCKSRHPEHCPVHQMHFGALRTPHPDQIMRFSPPVKLETVPSATNNPPAD